MSITMDMLDESGKVRDSNYCTACGGIFKILNLHVCPNIKGARGKKL